MGNKVKIIILLVVLCLVTRCAFDPEDNGYRKIDDRYYYRIDITGVDNTVMFSYKDGNSFVVIFEKCLGIYKVENNYLIKRINSNSDTVFSRVVYYNQLNLDSMQSINKKYFYNEIKKNPNLIKGK